MGENWISDLLDEAYMKANLQARFQVSVRVIASVVIRNGQIGWEVRMEDLDTAVTAAAQSELARRRGEQ